MTTKTAYVSVDDVKNAVDYPLGGDSPVSTASIQRFINESTDEIENIMNTKFGSVGDSGTAFVSSSASVFDTNADWQTDLFEDWILWVYSGTGSGQYRNIESNTGQTAIVSPDFDVLPDLTSNYRILKLGFSSAAIDGSGTKTFVTEEKPFVDLIRLKVDKTVVSASNVYQYPSGKLIMKDGSQSSVFSNTYPQINDLIYVYGVYKMPKIIERLCICISGIKTLISQVAGTYDDFTTVSLPGGFNASKGEPYTNLKSALDSLQREAKGIVYGAGSGEQLGADFRIMPSYPPFFRFG